MYCVQGFLLSNEVHIFGYARTKISDDELRNRIRGWDFLTWTFPPTSLSASGYVSKEGMFHLIISHIFQVPMIWNVPLLCAFMVPDTLASFIQICAEFPPISVSMTIAYWDLWLLIGLFLILAEFLSRERVLLMSSWKNYLSFCNWLVQLFHLRYYFVSVSVLHYGLNSKWIYADKIRKWLLRFCGGFSVTG